MSQPTGQRVLVIDDEPVVCLSVARILGEQGHQVDSRNGAHEGLEAARTGANDLVLLDVVMPEMDGLELLRRLREDGVDAEVIIITGYSTVSNAVQAMKPGAADYVAKPFTPDELSVVVDKVVERSALLREVGRLRERLAREGGFESMIGQSAAMQRVFKQIARVAPTDGTVLVTGESGTGKEMVAQAIHNLSPRAHRPLVSCDCSALTRSLLESELFGHAKGAFTGAVAAKRGMFETANGGTLFLDEVSNLDLETQGKLLRVLESRRVKQVGEAEDRPVDIRLVAATNRDLAPMVRAGQFREDLFYRLHVVPLHLPPFREREGDVPLLLTAFLDRFRGRNPSIEVSGLGPDALRVLEAHSWPGNVRELKNLVERLAIMAEGHRIEVADLPGDLRPDPQPASSFVPADWEAFKAHKQQVREAATAELERRFLVQALARAEGNVSQAARDLGMQRTHLHALLQRHGLAGA